jgi:hypothetical protein
MMNAKVFALLLAAPLALTACVSQVIGGGGGTGGSGGSGGSAGTGMGGPTMTASAMTRAQADVAWDNYWAAHGGEPGSSSSSGGDTLDPNDLFLHFADTGVTCEYPTVDLACGDHWQVTLVLPTSYQQVGSYSLDDPNIVQYSIMDETGPGNSPDPGDCSGGGGSLTGGTVEILSIDATEVHFRLTMQNNLFDNDPSGEYTAPRCQ